MFHDIVQLVGELAWPLVIFFVILKFGPGLKAILDELPAFLRRLRSAQGLGIEIELEKLDAELPIAEEQAKAIELKSVPEPKKLGDRHDG